MRPTEDKEAKLTEEETDEAWDNAFDTPIEFDHKPTMEEIIAIRLKAVNQAQLEKLERLGYRRVNG